MTNRFIWMLNQWQKTSPGLFNLQIAWITWSATSCSQTGIELEYQTFGYRQLQSLKLGAFYEDNDEFFILITSEKLNFVSGQTNNWLACSKNTLFRVINQLEASALFFPSDSSACSLQVRGVLWRGKHAVEVATLKFSKEVLYEPMIQFEYALLLKIRLENRFFVSSYFCALEIN